MEPLCVQSSRQPISTYPKMHARKKSLLLDVWAGVGGAKGLQCHNICSALMVKRKREREREKNNKREKNDVRV